MSDIVKHEGLSTALTAADIRAQVNLIQQVMNEVMQGPSDKNPEGIHYGVIPGTKKPSLYKAGAEKLAMTFRLRPIIDADRDIKIQDLGSGHREITVYCHVLNGQGLELATGIGSCSTMENKYRYRGGEKKSTGQAVPREYWNLKKDGRTNEAQELIGGRGFCAAKIEGEWQICEFGEKADNPDIADTYNTVLKMAKKRAFIDGILSATAASDIFTQDIEDEADTVQCEPAKPPIKMPTKRQEATPPPPAPASTAKNTAPSDVISPAMRSHLFATANENFVSKDALHEHLKTVYQIESANDIRKAWFNAIVDWCKNGGKNIETK